jgi:hypothetical protein
LLLQKEALHPPSIYEIEASEHVPGDDQLRQSEEHRINLLGIRIDPKRTVVEIVIVGSETIITKKSVIYIIEKVVVNHK